MDAYERLAVLQLIGSTWRLNGRERRTLRDMVNRSYEGER